MGEFGVLEMRFELKVVQNLNFVRANNINIVRWKSFFLFWVHYLSVPTFIASSSQNFAVTMHGDVCWVTFKYRVPQVNSNSNHC